MKKVGLIILALLFVSSLLINFQQVEASISEQHQIPLSGWAWSSPVGWISFNSEETTSPIDYSVRIGLDGNIRGFAWSENMEWIKFNDLDDFPDYGPDYSAKIDIDGTLEGCEKGQICGWARACSGTVLGDCSSDSRDGWDGWIRLDATHDYQGVEVVESESQYNSELRGWAWGSQLIDWISFSCRNNDNNCNYSNYGVFTDFEVKQPELVHPEEEEGFKVIQEDYCNRSNPQVKFNWDYESPYDLDQGGFEVQVVENGDSFDGEDCGSECVLLEGSYVYEEVPFTADNSYRLPEVLEFDEEYTARVRVWDEYGIKSKWHEKDFKTRIRYPEVKINLDRPEVPNVEEATYFTDETDYHGWGNQNNRMSGIMLSWEFEDALPPIHEGLRLFMSEVSTEFQSEGSFDVELEVTATIRNEEGEWIEESCSLSNDVYRVDVGPELPDWEEVDPF